MRRSVRVGVRREERIGRDDRSAMPAAPSFFSSASNSFAVGQAGVVIQCGVQIVIADYRVTVLADCRARSRIAPALRTEQEPRPRGVSRALACDTKTSEVNCVPQQLALHSEVFAMSARHARHQRLRSVRLGVGSTG
jgi:hypothetical protein